MTDAAPRHRLAWDFWGPTAAGTAAHHQRHLDEFLAAEGIDGETGLESTGPTHHAAWCIVAAADGLAVHTRLRSHRSEEVVE